MNKIIILLVGVISFPWVSVAFADNWPFKVKESPESIVTCGAGNGDVIAMQSVSSGINVEQCAPFSSTCAPCITSLEGQGCKVVDVIVTHGKILIDYHTTATYLLSCDDH